MSELYEVLKNVRECPKLYLGRKSLELLNAFISGYIVCQNKLSKNSADYLSGFQEFIEKKYGLETTHSWSSLIRFFASSDEEAFDEFYILLDKYLQMQNVST